MDVNQALLNTRPNPFVGPRPIETGEKIYGRERETNLLLSLLVAERILLLHSPSGAGKTSLIQAALIPRLLEKHFQVMPVVRLNRAFQTNSGSGSANRYVFSVVSSLEQALSDEQRHPEEELAHQSMAEYLGQLPEIAATPAPRSGYGLSTPNISLPSVFIFDQFEEILTLDPTDQQDKQEFFVQLGQVLSDPNRWALFSMREDYLPALDPYLIEVPTRFKTTFRLDLLQEEAASQAIQKTASQGGVVFTDTASNRLIEDLRMIKVQQPDGKIIDQPGPYVEPVQLQVVCRRLWEQLPADATEITEKYITSIGDVDQSLAAYYRETMAAIAKQLDIPERAIRDWFQYQLITEGGIRGLVMKGAGASEGLDNDAIRLLEDAHLIRSEKRIGATWFELAHDRLVSPVRKDNNDWYAIHLNLLQRQADLWERNKRPDSLLLRDQALKIELEWAQAHRGDLSPAEKDFLQACQETQAQSDKQRQLEGEKQRAEERAIAEQQRAEERARTARRLRLLLIVIAVFALIALALAGVAYQAQQNASQNAALANIARITSEFNATQANIARSTSDFNALEASHARGTSDANFAQANIAAEQAKNAQGTSDVLAVLAGQNERLARSSQLAALSTSYSDRRVADLSFLLAIEAYHVAPSLEAKNALLTGLQNHRTASQEFKARLRDEKSVITSVALSADGKWLAWGNEQGEVIVRDLQNRIIVPRVKIGSLPVTQVLFRPGSQTLVALMGGRLVLVDFQSGQVNNSPFVDPIQHFEFNPAGTSLAAITGSRVIVWDLSTNNTIAPVESPGGAAFLSLAWSPDNFWLATGDAANRLLLWNTETWENPEKAGPTEQEGPVSSLDWALDAKSGGVKLASGTSSGQVVIWDLDEGYLNQKITLRFPAAVIGLSFSPDGSILAAETLGSSEVKLFDVTNNLAMDPSIDYHGGAVTSLAFSPDIGQMLFIFSTRDAVVYQHTFVSGQDLTRQFEYIGYGSNYRFAIDSSGSLQTVYLGGVNDPIRVIPGDNRGPFTTEVSDATSVTFSPDGKSLGIGRRNGTIQILDLDNHQLSQPVKVGEQPVVALAYDARSARLASSYCVADSRSTQTNTICARSTVQLWDAKTLTPIGSEITLEDHFVTSIAFNPNMDQLALGSENKITLLNLENLQAENLVLEGHHGNVISLAYSPDGELMASGDNQRVILLWNTHSYQPFGNRLFGAAGAVLSLAFRPDGKELFSYDDSGTSLAWNLDPDQWVEWLCNLAQRNFTHSEWQQFFPEESYRPTCSQYP